MACRAPLKCSLMRLRASSRPLTEIRRCEVAVGTDRLAFMFSAILPAIPRSGTSSSPAAGAGGRAVGLTAGAATAAVAPLRFAWSWPLLSNIGRQLSST